MPLLNNLNSAQQLTLYAVATIVIGLLCSVPMLAIWRRNHPQDDRYPDDPPQIVR